MTVSIPSTGLFIFETVMQAQPSEFAKLAVVIYIAAWLASRGTEINKFSLGFVPFIFLLGIVGGLVMAEPDMGTTIIIFLTASTLFFVAGAPVSHLGLLIGVGGISSMYSSGVSRSHKATNLEVRVCTETSRRPRQGSLEETLSAAPQSFLREQSRRLARP